MTTGGETIDCGTNNNPKKLIPDHMLDVTSILFPHVPAFNSELFELYDKLIPHIIHVFLEIE